ncbi:MAG TPA: crosslink repair DNA glycosylase YcaQ family protein [Rhizobiaceae bacterium]|nr:crosslink repair DNA glycosylase YcaQ family protein [Rhizobiaceae bacterium]
MRERISLKTARRIALAAQGFGEKRPAGPIDRRHLKRFLARNGLLQMDSVNVLVRAHYMPVYSRLGAYPLTLIDENARGRKRLMFEYWAHEASLLPLELYPLMRWRMERAERGERVYSGLVRYGRENAEEIGKVLTEISERGPLAASDFDGQRGQGGWWGWSDVKRALEWLFWTGRLTTAERRPSFERVYDLPERVFPASVLSAPVPAADDAIRELLGMSARALGVATARDLRDYFRLPPEDVKTRLPELVEAGELLPVKVEGWGQQAYLHKAARVPRKVEAQALLSPFDPLVWERSRAERLFDFRYRIEIYTPAEKRIHGYYVLPFLLGETIAARVDLKADRQAGVLRVMSSHLEPAAPAHVAEALAAELSAVAAWLGLSDIEVAPIGELAPALSAAIRTAPAFASPG